MRARLTACVLAVIGPALAACPAPEYNDYVEGTTSYTSQGRESLEPQEDIPLASVGDTIVFLNDFRRHLDGLGDIPNAAVRSSQARLTLLQAIVATESLAQEAERRGYTDDPSVLMASNEALAEIILDRLLVGADNPVSVEDVDAVYHQRGDLYDRPLQVQIGLALFADEVIGARETDRLRQHLRNAPIRAILTAFRDVVQQHSIDAVSRDRGGDLGLCTIAELTALFGPDVTEDIVSSEGAGRLIGPLETESGWALLLVIRLRQELQRDLATVRNAIATELAEAARNQAASEWLAQHRLAADVLIDADALAQIDAAAPTVPRGEVRAPRTPEDSVLDALLSPQYDLTSLPALGPPQPDEGSNGGGSTEQPPSLELP